MSFPARQKPRILVVDKQSMYRGWKGEVVRERDGELQVKLDNGGAVLPFVWREVFEIHESFVAPKMKVDAVG